MFEGKDDYVNMTGTAYNRLYARYIGRNLDQLILAAGSIEGKRVLDVCSGSGAAAVRAKELGAGFVMAHDNSAKMLDGVLELGLDACSNEMDKDTVVFPDRAFNDFDLVVCRQAVNYWWSDEGLSEVLGALKHDGHFVYNTFHGDSWTDPSHPTTSQYEIDGWHYAETHWMVKRTDEPIIYHVQCCEGMAPHCTRFAFIHRECFAETLNKHPMVKDWTVERHGNTDIYVVERL